MPFQCCFFWKKNRQRSTNRSPTPRLRFPTPTDEKEEILLERCAKCNANLSVPGAANVFVCSICRCVNRVTLTPERRLSFIDCGIGESITIPNIPPLFQLGEVPSAQSCLNLRVQIPICSVCLEGIGDMVLEECGHGGICEECALQIALNKSVGGAHCPRCRGIISKVLRIGELHDDTAKCKELALPTVSKNEPPRVPPPVGWNKSKSGQRGGVDSRE